MSTLATFAAPHAALIMTHILPTILADNTALRRVVRDVSVLEHWSIHDLLLSGLESIALLY